MPILLHGLCFALGPTEIRRQIYWFHAVTRFLMKLFRTSNIDIINDCRSNFSFMLPSELIEIIYLFSWPDLSRHRLDVYHTSTHGVALVRIWDAGLKPAARGSLRIVVVVVSIFIAQGRKPQNDAQKFSPALPISCCCYTICQRLPSPVFISSPHRLLGLPLPLAPSGRPSKIRVQRFCALITCPKYCNFRPFTVATTALSMLISFNTDSLVLCSVQLIRSMRL